MLYLRIYISLLTQTRYFNFQGHAISETNTDRCGATTNRNTVTDADVAAAASAVRTAAVTTENTEVPYATEKLFKQKRPNRAICDSNDKKNMYKDTRILNRTW